MSSSSSSSSSSSGNGSGSSIKVYQHGNYGGAIQVIPANTADQPVALTNGVIGEVSSVVVEGSDKGVWHLIAPGSQGDVIVGTVDAKGGPKGDGKYPSWDGYFPNDTVTKVQFIKDQVPTYKPPSNSPEELAMSDRSNDSDRKRIGLPNVDLLNQRCLLPCCFFLPFKVPFA